MARKAKILKKLKEFTFEFIIVTLGILTAFNINKWDEKNKSEVEERKSYESIKNDLKTDLYVLNYYKKFHQNGINYLTPILEDNYTSLDSLQYYLQGYFDLQEGNATYINLKYSGKLELLENGEIKNSVLLFYETYYQGLASLSERHNKLVHDLIKPYIIKNFKFNSKPADLKVHLKDDEFLNLIYNQISLFQLNLLSFDQNEKLMNKIIDLINTELDLKE